MAGLEAELRRNIEGEVRFDPGSKAMYAVDASNYRQVPIGVVIPRSKEDVVQTVAACTKVRGPGAVARRRHQSGRAVLQCRHCDGLVEVHAWRAGSEHAPSAGRVSCRERSATSCATALCKDSNNLADLGSRSGDPQSLLFWRHDREQFLRRARSDGGQDRGEHRRAGGPAL